MSLDISGTIAPRSDQINADDLVAGPVVVTVTGVTRGNSEQPVNIVTDEFGPGRPYKPGKSMRRVLVQVWGKDASTYVGRRMTLYRDPKVKFGGEQVGGIRISHLSHIDKPITIPLTVTRGKRSPFVVQPLPDAPAPISDEDAAALAAEIAAAPDQATLTELAGRMKSLNLGAHRGDLLAAWSARRDELAGEQS